MNPIPHTDIVDSNLLETFEHLHRNPELSMAEVETSRFLQRKLEELGVELMRPYGATGFVADIRNGAGPVVAFRADMDGLPVREETGLDYASLAVVKNAAGQDTPVMHACGHDIHMTVGIGLARYLLQNRDQWSGTVLIIFQPGEETGQGAKDMLAAGLWEDTPKPECLFGLHVWPIRSGTVELVRGTTMAIGDSFEVTVKGLGGHGSQPQNTIDPILIASNLVVALQSVVARNIAPLEAGVVTVGTIHGGTKENIIPSEVTLTLNVRSFTLAQREVMLAAIHRIIEGVAAAYGAPSPVVREINSFPSLYSDPDLIDRLSAQFAERIGHDRVAYGDQKLASEDFGILAQSIDIPCAFWFIGGHDPETLAREDAPQNHSPYFAPDPVPTLAVGVRSAVAACYTVVGI